MCALVRRRWLMPINATPFDLMMRAAEEASQRAGQVPGEACEEIARLTLPPSSHYGCDSAVARTRLSCRLSSGAASGYRCAATGGDARAAREAHRRPGRRAAADVVLVTAEERRRRAAL
eukprot:CAMPEP_0119418446 /NCGR_PEP_ID=MMETSP1335-20130426/18262_1 /TAXON_ID=259385 /ORGANISM="Chrysoculter rhomboideus, Strain RCC1486" /LENGTH=118 /DNA_ID=CAMNT_0007443691 /DNA_START=68 /DNA_END=422 /DNA_ORIENTATION=+